MRFAIRHGLTLLGELNVIEKRTQPRTPETFVSVEDVQASLPAIVASVNRTLHVAGSLVLADDVGLALKWMAGLYALAVASRMLGSTGLFFVGERGRTWRRALPWNGWAEGEATGARRRAGGRQGQGSIGLKRGAYGAFSDCLVFAAMRSGSPRVLFSHGPELYFRAAIKASLAMTFQLHLPTASHPN